MIQNLAISKVTKRIRYAFIGDSCSLTKKSSFMVTLPSFIYLFITLFTLVYNVVKKGKTNSHRTFDNVYDKQVKKKVNLIY